jgi:hypothetical protein
MRRALCYNDPVRTKGAALHILMLVIAGLVVLAVFFFGA